MKTTAAIALLLCCGASLLPRSTVALPVTADDQDESITAPKETTVEVTTGTAAETTVESTTSMNEITVENTTWTEEITVESTTWTEETTIENTDRMEETTVENTDRTEETTIESTTGTEETMVEITTTMEGIMVESTTNDVTTIANKGMPAEVIKDKLSEQIRKILRHYQRRDPEGFPGAPIPDPLKIPPMNKNFGVADMTFVNMTVHGLSKFKVERVNVDLKKMQVYVLLKIKRMYVLGNYTLRSWFGRPAAGPFNVTLMDVDAEAAAALEPDEDGNLQATETDMDMRFKDCELDFKNLGFTASLFQGILSSVGSVMFEGIKPFIVTEVNTNLRADVNAQVKAITSKLPKLSVPVPDLAVAEGRAYVRRMGYDPYHVADRTISEGPLNFTVRDLTVRGLSDFRRVGDIGLQVRGPVLQIAVHVITGAVNGTLKWQYRLQLASAFAQSGVSNFTVDHVQVRALVNQSLDIREKPVLDGLQIEMGRVAVIMDRGEPLGYVLEVAVNSLPTLLRHMIVDALEDPIKMKVQTLLDEVQLEKMVEERLPELDRLEGQTAAAGNGTTTSDTGTTATTGTATTDTGTTATVTTATDTTVTASASADGATERTER